MTPRYLLGGYTVLRFRDLWKHKPSLNILNNVKNNGCNSTSYVLVLEKHHFWCSLCKKNQNSEVK
jgi:hypothetical protein